MLQSRVSSTSHHNNIISNVFSNFHYENPQDGDGGNGYETVQIRDGDNKILHREKIQDGFSLCHTCIRYLSKGKMPPMCSKNSLEPAELPQCLKDLTNVEKQLIVKNLVFIKVRNLPKTRMEAMNDR